jgi:hypothetical protein
VIFRNIASSLSRFCMGFSPSVAWHYRRWQRGSPGGWWIVGYRQATSK